VVEYLLCKCEALSSNARKDEREGGREEGGERKGKKEAERSVGR
jgi:hypothetical protein